MVLVSYGGNANRKEVNPKLESFKSLTYPLSWRLTANLTVSTTYLVEETSCFKGYYLCNFGRI